MYLYGAKVNLIRVTGGTTHKYIYFTQGSNVVYSLSGVHLDTALDGHHISLENLPEEDKPRILDSIKEFNLTILDKLWVGHRIVDGRSPSKKRTKQTGVTKSNVFKKGDNST